MADGRADEAASDVVHSVAFGFYSPDEVRKISVKEITRPDILDLKNSPIPGGLYDPALGPLSELDPLRGTKAAPCKSCADLSVRCPGHCGHIDLAKPLYNPLLFKNLKFILQISCFHCRKFRKNKEKVQILVSQLELIIRGDIIAARNLSDPSSSEQLLTQEQVENNAVHHTGEPYSTSDFLKQGSWTSLHYTEIKNLLSEFMHNPPKKCQNCGKINPKITNPTFGWLNKAMKGSDISANVIKESNIGLPFINEDQSDTQIAPEVENDRILESGKNARQTGEVPRPPFRGLPDECMKQMQSLGQRHLLPSEVERILEGLWKNELQLCTFICDIQSKQLSVSRKSKGYAMFFLKVLLVPPSKFRPPAASGSHGVLEHPQNVLLSKVLESNISLRNLITTDPDHPDIVPKWMDLQKSVNILYDSSKGFSKSDRDTSGIRQSLERKTGILRQKMMGKRVNFACRSVISPDPYLAVNEIGIPPYFALRLTYPERVTPWNVNKLRDAIENGPDIHPGATHYKEGIPYKLLSSRYMRSAYSRKLPTSRGYLNQSGKGLESVFGGKVVYRHLHDGDIVLVNRQPTLHKPSLMAHVVRVLKGERTIRMHYANCSTYNADFDGDEMNVHLPQDENSRSEAINIVNANMQYIVPTSGKPIRGLIQDHIISAVLLTKKDTFLTRDEYHQLLCAACIPAAAQLGKFGRKVSLLASPNDIEPLPPAILKPKPLWTGKQVISAILCYLTRGCEPFTIEKSGRIKKEYFTKNCSEQRMYIYNNELIHGMIDKDQFEKYGLVHTVHELYGADKAGTLLSLFSRLFTSFLQMHGFTCGVDDLLLVQHLDLERKKILGKSEQLSEDVHFRFIATRSGDIDHMELHKKIEKVVRSNGDSATTRLDRMMSNALNSLTSEINNIIFPNGLLKPFPKNCLSLMTASGAKGGSVNMTQISSLLGQQELEGKRVPRMASGKTLPSFPPWDISCRSGGFIGDRFLTGLRPQEYYFHCMAGRDGLVDTAVKTSRSGYLQRCIIKNLESLKVCYDHTVRDADGSVVQFMYGEDGVDVLKSSFLTKLDVLTANHRVLLEKLRGQLTDAHLSKSNEFIEKLPAVLRKEVNSIVEKERMKGRTRLSKKQRGSAHQLKKKDVMKIMEIKYLSSLAEPGEPVGVIAGQSIGEPSTQMTLNTFHLAGHGERNVTLGIPRLQEILMNAKENIQTPIMKCPLLDRKTWEDAEELAAKFRRICVTDIVESMEVSTVPFSIHKDQVSTIYKLTLKLYPLDVYPPHSDITLEARNEILEDTFLFAMEDAITKHLETLSKINDINVVSLNEENSLAEEKDEDEAKTKSSGGDDNDGGGGGGDDDNDNFEDQGADAEKRKRQISDEMEYEDGNEKETSAMVNEYEEEPPSGFEREIDQVEADDDFAIGEVFNDTETEDEAPGSPSADESKAAVTASKQDMKSGGKQTGMPKRNKKIKTVIYKKAGVSTFEAHFIFKKKPHILLAEIAQKTAKGVYLKQYKNIEQCSVAERKEKDKKGIELQTAGVNFPAFWDLEDHLSLNELECNDIHAMLNTYGVEAARGTIIKEVNNVFGIYGIRVDIRHLNLIADFMTFHGGYRPLNRLGMGSFGTSPFGKMTFETATRFIFEAASYGEVDTLESPSASVCLGQPMKMGTGCFDLMQNLVV